MKLGNNIQFLRTNMCLSQEELAGSIPKFV